MSDSLNSPDQTALRTEIHGALARARLKNPRYSLRAFSKKLGCSASALSEFLNGRRRFSVKVAERIVDRLNLDPQDRFELLSRFNASGRCSTDPYFKLIR